MRSPAIALMWEIWSRNRGLVWWVLGITLATCLFNSVLSESVQPASTPIREFSAQGALAMLYMHLGAATLLFILAIFSFTEFNPQTGSSGFPYRLFALPVTSFQLVAVPIFLSVIAVELVYLAWTEFVLTPGPLTDWFAVLIGTYLVLYQTILWTLARLPTLRLIVLGLTGITFMFVPVFPWFLTRNKRTLPWWLSDQSSFVGYAVIAFLVAWIYVARQRSGGGSGRGWLKAFVERISAKLPRRDKSFSSPSAAQFWFEWRRCGLVLPLLAGALLSLVIGPVSWYMRHEPAGTSWILAWTLFMPIILAAAVGKAFSRPDFWSSDLSISGFVAVRPMAEDEMVAIRLKVAAGSATIAWLLVLAFLSVWLALWANLDRLNFDRLVFGQLYGHSVYPQYAIAVLFILAGMFLTWRFLVGSLWLGLSGNKTLFIVSAASYVVVPLFVLPGFLVLVRVGPSFLVWMHELDRLLPALLWVAALAVAAKFWIAAFSWRKVAPQRVRQYLIVWLGSTLCLISLATLLWAGLLRYFLPSDIYRVRSLLILAALLVMPFGRLGLATSSLARNRHR